MLRTLAPLALALAAFSGPASSQAVTTGGARAVNEVRSWLLRIHEAASRRNFQGTFIVSGGGSITSARIAHFVDGGAQFERIESLDGRQRRVYRHNDVVHTVWPGSLIAMIEQRGQLSSFPALLQGADDRIADWYELEAEGVERVAGREADVLAVRPRDAWRYGYRLWADRSSSLLLRIDVIGERGEVLETSAFSDVAIGLKAEPQTVVQPMKKLDGYRVVRPTTTPTRLEAEGWSLKAQAPGFRLVSSVARRIDAPGEAPADPGATPVLQSIWSDGLTFVSVFIEPFRADRHGKPLLAGLGATLTMAQRHGEFWVTVVGDAPQATLKSFAGALERKKP